MLIAGIALASVAGVAYAKPEYVHDLRVEALRFVRETLGFLRPDAAPAQR